VLDVLLSSEQVYGVTSLHDLLYVLRADSIDVYASTSDHTRLGYLPLPGLDADEWNDLTSSSTHSCLYVADCANKLIRAVRPDGSVRDWDVNLGRPCGVSVTPDEASLLVTFADCRELLELRLDAGDWLHRVPLAVDIERPWHAVSRRNHVLRAEMAAFDGPYGAADVRPAALRVQQAGNGQEPGRPTAPELTSISLDELDAEAARQQPTSVKQSFRGIYPNGSWESNRARQLYKNISMLFLFPVKDGKLSTGVIAMFNASCYG